MKAKFNPFSVAAIALLMGSVALTSCDKNEGSLDGAGKTIVKLPQATEDKVAIALDLKPGSVNIVLLDVRRDAANEGELNKAITVKIKNDTSVVGKYNRAHNTNYTTLPMGSYQIDAGNPFNGDEWTVTFNPGEHAKPIMIKLDPSTLDLTKQYAFGFTITDASGATISSLKSALVEVGVKNPYDGIYAVMSGYVQRYTAPGTPESPSTLSGPLAGNPDVAVVTVGPNTVEIQGLQWTTGSNSGVGGIANLRATVDPATNLVTMQALGNPTLVNWAGKENRYDPATKTLYLAFNWNPATTPREYEIELKFKEPR
jgi:hypothetical protein